MKHYISIFFKGLLLYVTVLLIMIAIMSIDSLYDNGYLIDVVLIIAALCCLCHKFISEKELHILTLT